MFSDDFQDYKFDNYGLVRLPTIDISKEQKESVGLPETATNYEFLTELTRKGFREYNVPKDQHKIYGDRIKYELGIFEELGFTDYVLLVWMVINKARELGVFIDYGRGSCVGSMVFFLLKITGVDAVKKKLFFERFVSRTRSKKQVIDGVTYLQGDLVADADLNLGEGREEIVKWLEQIYPNRLCKISNLSTFTGKILIKDIYKALAEVSEDEANHISNMIEKHSGIVEEISTIYEINTEFKKWANQNRAVYDTALKLNGLIRQESSHASGYAISFYDLYDFIPLELNKKGELTSGFDMREICNFTIKLDLLSLSTNKVIKQILTNISEDITDLGFAERVLDNDPLIYDQFQANTLLPFGIYQISARTGYEVTNKVKPKDIFALSDVNALARPGALDYVSGYVDNDQPSPHSLFDNILKPTHNYCLYQEQMMQMFQAVGFTPDEAEICRKIVGKKQVEKVKEWEQKIYDKIAENHLPEKVGKILWKILNDSSKYSFNKAHSIAVAYLSALTVYLKYKYPLQFYCACLNSIKDLTKPEETVQENIDKIKNELKIFNIELLPPNIVKSSTKFEIEGKNIRFSLGAIKGVSEKSLEKLEKFKQVQNNNKFELFKTFKNCGLNVGVSSALIQAGTLDIPGSRSRLVLELQTFNILTPREKLLVFKVGSLPEINYDTFKAILYLVGNNNDKGKPYIKPSRFETIKRKKAKYQQIYELNSRNENLCQYWYEKMILGYSYSQSITSIYGENIDLVTVKDVLNSQEGDKCRFIGFLSNFRKGKTKAKSDYISFNITDDTGLVKVMVFNQRIESLKEINGRMVEEEDLVIVEGSKKDGGTVFADRIGIQTTRIFMKLRDLKDYSETPEND